MVLGSEPRSKVLVSDFDGTITRRDFYRLVLEQVPPGTPDFWSEYLAGRLSHFDAINAVFGAYRPGETGLIELTRLMGLEPGLGDAVGRLRSEGWDLVVASAGCSWYIEKLLREAGVTVEIHANPGSVVDGRLLMEWPRESPFFSPETGIDKAGVVRDRLAAGAAVAFAGDGPPDLKPALLVPGPLRFATKHLARELTRLGEPFRPFSQWSDVVLALTPRPDGPASSLGK